MTAYLTLEDLLCLIGDLGVGPIRDLGLLDSARHRPTTTVFGDDAYRSLADKAAALLESLLHNHPLVDGNKRLGWLAVVVFCGLNDTAVEVADDEAYDLVVGVAAGAIDRESAAVSLSRWFRPAS